MEREEVGRERERERSYVMIYYWGKGGGRGDIFCRRVKLQSVRRRDRERGRGWTIQKSLEEIF